MTLPKVLSIKYLHKSTTKVSPPKSTNHNYQCISAKAAPIKCNHQNIPTKGHQSNATNLTKAPPIKCNHQNIPTKAPSIKCNHQNIPTNQVQPPKHPQQSTINQVQPSKHPHQSTINQVQQPKYHRQSTINRGIDWLTSPPMHPPSTIKPLKDHNQGTTTSVTSTNLFSPANNGVRQELKIQMALCVKLGLFPVQWQCRFRTLVSTFFKFYIHGKWVEFQLIIQ